MNSDSYDFIPEEYDLIKPLNSGGYARVFLVRRKDNGAKRALKVLEDEIEDENDTVWKRFVNECKTLCTLGSGSPLNIVRVYNYRLVNKHATVEMDYVEGKTVHGYIRKEKFVAYDEFIKFVHQIVGAVAYCHVDVYRDACDPEKDRLERGRNGSLKGITPDKEAELIERYEIVHNDLHSGNIIRKEREEQYVLIDFGQSLNTYQGVKSRSRFSGAPEYCSPEKLLQEDISARSDVYSLGVLLYQILAGQVPYPDSGRNLEKTEADRRRECKRRQEETPQPIFTLRKEAFESKFPDKEYTRDYPSEIDKIIDRCLSYDSTQRYKNAKELLEALKAVFKVSKSTDTPISDSEGLVWDDNANSNDGEIEYVVSDKSLKWKKIYFSIAILAILAATIYFVISRPMEKTPTENPPQQQVAVSSGPKDSTKKAEENVIKSPVGNAGQELPQKEDGEDGEAGGGSKNIGKGNKENDANQQPPKEEKAAIPKDKQVNSKGNHTTKANDKQVNMTTSGVLSLGYATWTGGVKDGKPNGKGSLRFNYQHKIDRSTQEMANPGDVLEASYENGRLLYGKLYNSAGELISTIIP